MALPDDTHFLTEAEYLAFDRESEIKHEYISGEVVAMTRASRAHNLICTHTSAALVNQLLNRPCEVYQSDMRVYIAAASLYTYPDISVVCDEP